MKGRKEWVGSDASKGGRRRGCPECAWGTKHLMHPPTASLKGKIENWAENGGLRGVICWGRDGDGVEDEELGGDKERKEELTGVE